jgi:N-methylhydantoinase B
VTAPERSILNALPPAPVGARHIIGHFLPGAIFGALAQVIPERVMAEGAANIWNTQFTGTDEHDRLWTYVWFSTGGTGARPNKDGISTAAFPSGISGVPTEVIESLSPVVIHRREYRQDSGGPGQFRGGLGQIMDISVRTARPFTFSPLFDRTKFAAAGYAGGKPGALAEIRLSTGEVLDRKGVRELAPETRLQLSLPGGGGYGSPFERDPDAVLDDIRNGLVSVESAREDYGVVLIDDGATVDHDETERMRSS